MHDQIRAWALRGEVLADQWKQSGFGGEPMELVGARDLAFPRLNLASWYIYILGGLFTLAAAAAGGVDTGWTFYTPYSSIYSNTHVALTVIGIFITGFSSILTGLNFIVTIHTMRAPGMTWFRLPLFVWAHYATSIIFILGTPVIAIAARPRARTQIHARRWRSASSSGNT